MSDKKETVVVPTQVPEGQNTDVVVQKSDDAVALAIASSKGFIGRLQLMTSSSDPCKDGKFPVNHFAIVEGSDNFTDMGETVKVKVLAHRAMALEWGDETTVCYDPKIIEGKPTGEFLRIMQKSDGGIGSNAMYGVQFLVWSPAVKRFLTFFCGSPTLRNEVGNFLKNMNKSSVLVAKRISNKKHTWFGVAIQKCSEELADPDTKKLVETVTTFLNPPAEEKVAVENPEKPARG